MNKIDKIEKEIRAIKYELVGKEPEHFGTIDFVYAFFGALLVGLTFALKGLLISVAKAISWQQAYTIVLMTILMVVSEIYLIGYSKVKNKKARRPLQFIAKRLFAISIVTVIVAIFLTWVFDIYELAGSMEVTYKIVCILIMPCGIGATISDLFRRISF